MQIASEPWNQTLRELAARWRTRETHRDRVAEEVIHEVTVAGARHRDPTHTHETLKRELASEPQTTQDCLARGA